MTRTQPRPVRPLALDTSWALTLVCDAIVLLVFAAIGRRSHDEGNPITGVLETAWPFLVAALLGHLVVWAWRRSANSLAGGAVIWVCTVAGAMILRHVTDQGTAFSFIVVATCFTGFFLLGWRAVRALLARRAG